MGLHVTCLENICSLLSSIYIIILFVVWGILSKEMARVENGV